MLLHDNSETEQLWQEVYGQLSLTYLLSSLLYRKFADL